MNPATPDSIFQNIIRRITFIFQSRFQKGVFWKGPLLEIMKLDARQKKLRIWAWVVFAMSALCTVGIIMVIVAGVKKSDKSRNVAESVCRLSRQLNSSDWVLILNIGDIVYTNPTSDLEESGAEEFTPCHYQERKLPGSLKIGHAPSTKVETIVMIVGFSLIGIFVLFFLIAGIYVILCYYS